MLLHMFGCPPHSPYVKTPPTHVPMLPCASSCSGGYLYLILGCRGPSICLDTPMCLDASPGVQHSHTFVCSPICLYVLGVNCMCYGGKSHMLVVRGCQHTCQASGVCQYIHWMSIMLHLVPFL